MAVSDAVKVKKNCDFHTLLVGMKHRILTLENKSVASCISKYTLTIQPNNPAPNYLSEIMKTMCTQWSVWRVIVVVIIITQNTNALQLVNGWAVETLNGGRPCACSVASVSLTLRPCGRKAPRPWDSPEEYWSGWPCPPPGDLPRRRTEPASPASLAL